MVNKRLLIIGGTGYMGRTLIDLLKYEKYRIRCLVRKNIQLNRCETVLGNFLDEASLIKATKDVDVVVHLGAIVKTYNKKDYTNNLIGLRNVISAMKKNKVRKIVYYSTQNIYLKNKGYYSRSKYECEEILKKSDVDYIILRPNYIYGIDKNNYFSKLASLINKFRIAPIIGNGKNKIQPVLKDELARITINLIKKFKPKTEYDISGKETISLREIISMIESALKKKSIQLRIPVVLLKPLKKMIPFDVDGFDEDRLAKKPYKYSYSSFKKNIVKITSLLANR